MITGAASAVAPKGCVAQSNFRLLLLTDIHPPAPAISNNQICPVHFFDIFAIFFRLRPAEKALTVQNFENI